MALDRTPLIGKQDKQAAQDKDAQSTIPVDSHFEGEDELKQTDKATYVLQKAEHLLHPKTQVRVGLENWRKENPNAHSEWLARLQHAQTTLNTLEAEDKNHLRVVNSGQRQVNSLTAALCCFAGAKLFVSGLWAALPFFAAGTGAKGYNKVEAFFVTRGITAADQDLKWILEEILKIQRFAGLQTSSSFSASPTVRAAISNPGGNGTVQQQGQTETHSLLHSFHH